MIDLIRISKECSETAFRRGQIGENVEHWPSAGSISGELMEFIKADENKPSEHLSGYTEAQEELADILIVCLTELNRRGVDVEKLIIEKTEFNKTRNP